MDIAELRKTFSARIRKLRGERKQNQGQFADSVGISRGAMSYYEQEARTPDIGVLRAICEECEVSADYLIGLIPDRNHAVSDVCLETGLFPKAVRRLRVLEKLKKLEIESVETIFEHFIDDDPKEALMMTAHTEAATMVNVLLSNDEGLSILTLLGAIISGAELVTGSEDKPHFRLFTDHKYIRTVYPLKNVTAALWVNVQEEAAKLRDRADAANAGQPD